jgi:hypothetical protein
MVFITEIECVYCAIRAEGLIQFSILSLYDPNYVHARFVVEKEVLRRDFLQVLQFFPICIIPLILILITTSLLAEGQMGAAWGPSKKQCSFENLEALDRIVISRSRYWLKGSSTSRSSHGQRLMQHYFVWWSYLF